MRIRELIRRLQQIQQKAGNIEAFCLVRESDTGARAYPELLTSDMVWYDDERLRIGYAADIKTEERE